MCFSCRQESNGSLLTWPKLEKLEIAFAPEHSGKRKKRLGELRLQRYRLHVWVPVFRLNRLQRLKDITVSADVERKIRKFDSKPTHLTLTTLTDTHTPALVCDVMTSASCSDSRCAFVQPLQPNTTLVWIKCAARCFTCGFSKNLTDKMSIKSRAQFSLNLPKSD